MSKDTQRFEWDPAKAEGNLRKHGVSFEAATLVFEDRIALERLDTRIDYGEDRFIVTGSAAVALLTVVYVERGDRIRIISARRATRRERQDYNSGQPDS